jgi:quercetin dioxygenase-like cupin family protein
MSNSTPPHTHNGASIIATVIKGKMLNQMVHHGEHGHSEVPKIYEQGESWYEAPGCHHVRSENAGQDEEEAVFVASMVIESETLVGAEGEEEVLGRVFLLDADS